MKIKNTFIFSAELHMNKFNHIGLSIELRFMMILSLKINMEELFY